MIDTKSFHFLSKTFIALVICLLFLTREKFLFTKRMRELDLTCRCGCADRNRHRRFVGPVAFTRERGALQRKNKVASVYLG